MKDSTQIYLMIGFFVVVLFLLYNKSNENLNINCTNCEQAYAECMEENKGNKQAQEACIGIFCASECENCAKPPSDCESNPATCTKVTIPLMCQAVDESQVFFNDQPMCEEQLKKLCNNPKVQQLLADPYGMFATAEGYTPCYEVCRDYITSENDPNDISVSGNLTRISDNELVFSGQYENFVDELPLGTIPPFDYPTYIPQPQGNQGWGYRDPVATRQTLLWEQNQPAQIMPNYSPPQTIMGYHTHLVESAPIEKKHSPLESTQSRPVVPYIRPNQVLVSNPARWT